MKIALFCLSALCLVSPAAADCRAEVRALLLQAAPATETVASARAVCEAAQASGDAVATYHLALLDLGPGQWAPERAAERIRTAAEAGVPEAQYWLAWQLDKGPLLPGDPAAARRWYEAAARQSHRLAILRLAEAHERGELGLAADAARAAELRAVAAQCPAETG